MSVKLYILPNVKGGKYTGTLDDKKQPHGVGSLRFDNGHFYEGQWQHGEVTGKGEAIGATNPATSVQEHITNSVIDKHVKKDEESSLVSENASTASSSEEKKAVVHYNGEWRDGRMEGYGTYSFENGDIFDGEWRYNRPNGNGIYKYKATGDEFVGSFVNGQRSGKGIYKHGSGASYDGQWHQDLRHGKGLEIFTSGNKFEGYWLKDKRHGKGLYFVQRTEPPTGDSSASTTASSSKETQKSNRKSLWNWGLGNPAKRHASAPPSLNNTQKDQRRKSIFNYLFATSSQNAEQVFEEDPLYIIYEHVWENGELKSEKQLKGKPALFPEPPEELEEIVLLNQLEESGKANQKVSSFAEKVEIVEDLSATPTATPATPTATEEKAGKLAKMKLKKKNVT